MRGKNSIQSLLWKNFAVMVVMTFFLIAVPYYMIVGLTYYFDHIKYVDIRSAAERMENDYHQIETQDIVEKNGGIDIVTGELQVIHLGGRESFSKTNLTRGEWTEFLKDSGGLGTVGYDIAYNELEDFWLVLSVPVAMTIRIDYASNTDSTESASMVYLLLLVVGTYFLLTGICAVCYARLTSRRLTSPIRSLCEYTQRLEEGDYQERIPECSISEIRDCQNSLNHLSKRLEQNEELRDTMERRQKRLVMEISHDLKNPLAGIQGYSELLLNTDGLSKEKEKSYLELIHKNGIRANELLLSLFYYSQIESEDFSLQFEETDMCEFMRMLLADEISMIEEQGFLTEIDIPEECYPVKIDAGMMHRVFDNLIQNAMKYNQPETMLTIRMYRRDNWIEILVQDNGCGIPKDQAEAIFEPFRRLDSEVRNSRAGGSGLGLAIVKRIVEMHGGSITLISGEGEGCLFTVRIPSI